MNEELIEYLNKNNIPYKINNSNEYNSNILIDVGAIPVNVVDPILKVILSIIKRKFQEEIKCRRKIYGWKSNSLIC